MERVRKTESYLKAHILICTLQILNNLICTLSKFQKVLAAQTCKILLRKFPDMEPSAVGSPVGVDLIKDLKILKSQNAI